MIDNFLFKNFRWYRRFRIRQALKMLSSYEHILRTEIEGTK